MGKILDEHVDNTNGAKESTYFREVGARTPVNDLVDPSRVWDAAFRCTNVAYYGDLVGAQKQLFAREGYSAVFHPLDDAVEVLKMFPVKVVDATVLQDCLEGAVLALICSCGDVPRVQLRL